MKINWRKMMKREAFFLRTGKLSRRRHLVKPTYRHCHKPAIAKDVKPELIETVAKCEDAPAAVGQADLNFVVEVPLSTKLEAIRQ